ncbi:MAG: septum formation initiator family protein [Desulfobulbaceae bacterium]|nr:septum formation initiator family protein [Desulfobulbaceae bacterium]
MSFIKKKPKSKQKLSRLQEGRVMKIVFFLLVLALLWIFFAPGSGVVTLISKRSELKKAQEEAVRIEQQIDELQNEIDRLHNDPSYLEDIARKEYGLLKKNEEVYDFSKSKPKK